MQQQHQQQQPAPTRLRRLGENRVEGDTQSNVKQEADSSRTEITTSVFNEIDLHVDGIPQEAILNDEIQMKVIKETLQKLQIGSQMQSMRHDLNKEDMIFCNHIHSPVSTLLETYSRRGAAVSMRKLVETRRGQGEPDQIQIRRTCQTVLQSIDK